MVTLPRPESRALPTSSRPAHRPSDAFDPDLEGAYVRARLFGNRTLIRVACTFAALLALSRAVEQAVVGFWHAWQPIALALVLLASVALALIAWTQVFERAYLPFARVIVPARNVVTALFIAGAAARGQLEMLMFIPLMILAPYFFLGLSERTAFLAALLCFASFNLAAAAFGLALPVTLRVAVLLIVEIVACTIATRQLERLSRKSFLDSHRISEFAEHDALTGLKNRRVFDEQLGQLWRRAVEERCSIAMLLIDVDHFKAFNDRYGHQAGDQILQRVAQTVQRFVSRPLDVLARYGGEEFAIILYDIDAREAEALAERMRRAVSELENEPRSSRSRAAVTISIGVAFIEPSSDRQARGALQLADQALYEAKLRGRNRVTLMDQTAHRLLETGIFTKAQAAT
jgi:diguanylate cyclase (GGDEF)-like protein